MLANVEGLHSDDRPVLETSRRVPLRRHDLIKRPRESRRCRRSSCRDHGLRRGARLRRPRAVPPGFGMASIERRSAITLMEQSVRAIHRIQVLHGLAIEYRAKGWTAKATTPMRKGSRLAATPRRRSGLAELRALRGRRRGAEKALRTPSPVPEDSDLAMRPPPSDRDGPAGEARCPLLERARQARRPNAELATCWRSGAGDDGHGKRRSRPAPVGRGGARRRAHPTRRVAGVAPQRRGPARGPEAAYARYGPSSNPPSADAFGWTRAHRGPARRYRRT